MCVQVFHEHTCIAPNATQHHFSHGGFELCPAKIASNKECKLGTKMKVEPVKYKCPRCGGPPEPNNEGEKESSKDDTLREAQGQDKRA